MTKNVLLKISEKGGARLPETLLSLLERKSTASTLELAILTGRSAKDVRDCLNSLQSQGRVRQISQVAVAIWQSTRTVKSEQLVEFRKQERVI